MPYSLKGLESLLLDNAFWAEQKAEVLKRLEPTMRAIFDEGVEFAQSIDVSTGVKALIGFRADFLDPPEDLLNDIAGQTFRTYTDDWWAQLEHTTRERLRTAIINAAQNGTGSRGVVREIRPLFDAVRARRIGVTETTRLFGKGAIATYRATAVPEWIWRTVEDGHVCPTCESLGGTVFPVSQEFDPAHVTCRCFPSPVIRTNTRTRRAPRNKK